MTLTTRWTQKFKAKKDKEDFEKILRNSVIVLSRLAEILEEDEKQLNIREISEKMFESPNWAEHQAFLNGRKYQLRQTKALLEFLNNDR